MRLHTYKQKCAHAQLTVVAKRPRTRSSDCPVPHTPRVWHVAARAHSARVLLLLAGLPAAHLEVQI